MSEYWVCARNRITKEWVQCVRFKTFEHAEKYAEDRVKDFLEQWVRIEDEKRIVIKEYKL